MRSKVFTLALCILAPALALALEVKNPKRENLPPHLKGIPWKGKKMKHGLLKWQRKKPYTPMRNTDASERGKIIYMNNCMGCHGVDGSGDGPVTINKDFKTSNLKDSAEDFSNHYLAFQIELGKGNMPAWIDVLSEDEIWDLTHYLHELTNGK